MSPVTFKPTTPPAIPPTTIPPRNDPAPKKETFNDKGFTTSNGNPTPTPAPGGKTTPQIEPSRIDFSQYSDIISTIVNLLSGGLDITKIGLGINAALSRDFTANPLTAAERSKYALTANERDALILENAKKAEPNRDFTKNPLTSAERSKYAPTDEQVTTAIQTKLTAETVKGTFTGLDKLFEKILGAGNSLTAYIKKNGGDVATLIADVALSIATGKPLSPKSSGILVGAVGLLATELLKATGLDKEIQAILTKAGLSPAEAKSVTDFIMGASLLIASGVLGGDMSQALKVAGLDNTVLSLVTTLVKDGAFNLSPETAQKFLEKLDPNKPGNVTGDLQNLINSLIVPIQKAIAAFTSTVQETAPQETNFNGGSA